MNDIYEEEAQAYGEREGRRTAYAAPLEVPVFWNDLTATLATHRHPWLADDRELEEHLVERLHTDVHTRAYDLDVAVDHGAVWIRGMVPSTIARREAELDAVELAGPTAVHNEIRVARAA